MPLTSLLAFGDGGAVLFKFVVAVWEYADKGMYKNSDKIAIEINFPSDKLKGKNIV